MAQPGQQYQHQYSQQHQYPQQYQQYQDSYMYGQASNHQNYLQQNYNASQQYPHQHSQQPWQQYGHQYVQQYPQQQHHQYHPQSHQYFQQLVGNSAQHEPETCYNCGVSDHIAQNCPEPRRPVPVGSLKRRKPNYNQQYQSMDNGQGSTNMQALQAHQRPMGVQQAYTQFPHSYSPQTPHSAQSPGALQWHAQPHPPAPSYQATQQSLYQQRNIPYQSQLQSAPPTPGAGPHNGPTTQQQASPTTSQYGPIMHASGSASAPPLSLSQDDQCALSESHAFNNEETQLSIEIPDDDEEEDLNSLDVPDLPQAIRLFGQAILKPVSRPLPANFIVADAIYPMAPPPPEADGRCFSKYSEDLNEARSLEEMRNLACWKDRQGDTIFQEILSNDNITLLDDCLNKVRGSQKILTDDDVHRKSRSESRSVAPRSAEAAEMAESLETLERALAEAKAKQAEMIRNRQKAKLRRHSENRQPVDEQIGDSDTKVEQQSPSNLAMPGYSDQRSPSEATPKTFTSGPSPPIGNPRNIQSSPVSMALRPGRRPSSENGSKIHNPDSSALQANGPSWRAPQFHQSPRVPPPPPPAPLDLPQNGPMQSPNSSGGEHHGFVTNGSAYCQYGNHPQSGSPTQYRSDGASAHKRTYDQAAESSSSEDDDDSPRRQEDDVMPKHKRRQPKVAEAYSRRW